VAVEYVPGPTWTVGVVLHDELWAASTAAPMVTKEQAPASADRST
jgi:hypothetical protein